MSTSPAPDPVKEREMAQKFVQLVMMQAQNTLYVLGKIASPDGRAMPPDLGSAKMFIDQLEVLEYKTRGNLIPQEEKILKEALTQVRLAFVEASGGTPPGMMPDRAPAYDLGPEEDEEMPEPEAPAPAQSQSKSTPAAAAQTPISPDAKIQPSTPEENKKKFSKSYG
ncbi:MAG: DUF1844 domain-containing protein [Candidatus Methylacidiphilales bacterium]|nr:DUF1844 domain-containing protein [Candidatus Methylacidiphilales bacterium]